MDESECGCGFFDRDFRNWPSINSNSFHYATTKSGGVNEPMSAVKKADPCRTSTAYRGFFVKCWKRGNDDGNPSGRQPFFDLLAGCNLRQEQLLLKPSDEYLHLLVNKFEAVEIF
jgi:hypothetical protein